MSKKNVILLPLLLFCGCVSTQEVSSDINTGDWKIWQGRGLIDIKTNEIVYTPVNLQDEEYDSDVEGRGPAAIAAKEIHGKNWILDIKTMFLSRDREFNRLTVGLWFGEPNIRPSLGSPAAKLVLALSRTRGPENEHDGLTFQVIKKDGKKIDLPVNSSLFRFQRKKNKLTFYYSLGYNVDFKEVFTVNVPDKYEPQLILGARIDGHADNAIMKIRGLLLNGKNFF